MAAGLGLLLFLPVPLLRSMGVGGLLIPLASIAAATPQPACSGCSDAVPSGRAGDGSGTRLWARLARSIMRRPLVYLLAGGALLLAAAAPLARPADLQLVLRPPASPEAMRGYALLRDRVGRGR